MQAVNSGNRKLTHVFTYYKISITPLLKIFILSSLHTMASKIQYNIIIIRRRAFRTSSTLALIKAWPDTHIIHFASITLYTASRDISKIVRTIYPNPDIVKFAEQATNMWKEESLYQYYYQISQIQTRTPEGEKNTYKGPVDKEISPENLLERLEFDNEPHNRLNLKDGQSLQLNDNIIYINSALTLQALAREALNLGVLRVEKDITRIIINKQKVCEEVKINDNFIIAKQVIVAVSVQTPSLLQKSNILYLSDYFIITAVKVTTRTLNKNTA